MAKPGEVRQNGINILGGNTLDWQEENTASLRGWIEEKGFSVIADLGGNGKAADIARAAEASVNLVVTVSGLAAAKYLKSEYGTPYIAMAPFGKSQADRLSAALPNKMQPECSRQGETSRQPENGQKQEVLIIGEQFMGNAIRETLICDYGMENIQVCTFYTLEKTLAQPGDRRIRSEQEAEMLLNEGGFHNSRADPLLRGFAPKDSRWIDLPHKAFQLYGEHQPLPLFLGDSLSRWLDTQLV